MRLCGDQKHLQAQPSRAEDGWPGDPVADLRTAATIPLTHRRLLCRTQEGTCLSIGFSYILYSVQLFGPGDG
ncbi:OPT oligopeptide transporter [Aspergillus luchuensis]|uniref:OPT oligopeptide transporter n=1 Tax=Aspergillus kawachii TaxID=1069201 RepID=A0A146FLQ4_ASPKA|nr:OPT oligopeptide transporter [Aspergillus luchuensis]